MGCLKLAYNPENKSIFWRVYNPKVTSKTRVRMYDYGARMYDPQLGRWHVTDPASENGHYNYTPYAYVYNNPLLLIDPFGLDSSFYNEAGTNINQTTGDNGKTSNYYVIKTSKTAEQVYGMDRTDDEKVNGISSDDATKTENEILNGNLSGDHMNNLVSIESPDAMKSMLNSIQDNGGGDVNDPSNNSETAGNFKNSSVTDVVTGQPGVLEVDQDVSTPNRDFHSHPSGYKTLSVGWDAVTHSLGTTTLGWQQPPSGWDISHASNNNQYVVGMRHNAQTIYIYNKTGVVATIPGSKFK